MPDLSTPEFPGIYPRDGGFAGPNPTPELHPHLQLDTTMTSIPKVYPGDAVFWHCDVVHSVETLHAGLEDSAGKSSAFDTASPELMTLFFNFG